MKIVCWGTYDLGKPRVRILLDGLRKNGVDVLECHADIWSGIEDKSRVLWKPEGWLRFARWLLSYPWLVVRYLALPAHDLAFVGYMGHLDVIVLAPFARLRKAMLVWDAFLSLYDTVVMDRRLVSPNGFAARLLFAIERLACRSADLILLDTRAHAAYFCEQFALPPGKVEAIPLGAEVHLFLDAVEHGPRGTDARELTVLFFGQLIPLHGVDTILEAALLSKGQGIHWTVIGRGQGEAKLSAFLDAHPDAPVRWIHWLQQEDLVAEMGKADVCLGVFGTSDKAARVIPNKVYQILAAGRPLITRDSPAIRELIGPSTAGVWLVPPADPPALLKAVQAVRDQAGEWEGTRLHQDLAERIAPQAIGGQLSALLHARLVQRRQGAGR